MSKLFIRERYKFKRTLSGWFAKPISAEASGGIQTVWLFIIVWSYTRMFSMPVLHFQRTFFLLIKNWNDEIITLCDKMVRSKVLQEISFFDAKMEEKRPDFHFLRILPDRLRFVLHKTQRQLRGFHVSFEALELIQCWKFSKVFPIARFRGSWGSVWLSGQKSNQSLLVRKRELFLVANLWRKYLLSTSAEVILFFCEWKG